MAYITAADFRMATLAEFCVGIDLTHDEARTDLLESAIARQSQAFDDYTGDHYESVTKTVTVWADDTYRLYLPDRATGIDSVSIGDEAITDYTLHSSLDAEGERAIRQMDWLDRDDDTWGTGPVEVSGAFGWVVTPDDVKRAVAIMVWDHFKPMRGDLRRAQRISTQQESVDFVATSPLGIPEADRIIEKYQRDIALAV